MDQTGPGSLGECLLQQSGNGKTTCSANHVESRCLCRRMCKSLGEEERTWGSLPVSRCVRHSCVHKAAWVSDPIGWITHLTNNPLFFPTNAEASLLTSHCIPVIIKGEATWPNVFGMGYIPFHPSEFPVLAGVIY